jgi:phosphoribosylformimino-5-aminoimidazole carboxamide ribotide isomerase
MFLAAMKSLPARLQSCQNTTEGSFFDDDHRVINCWLTACHSDVGLSHSHPNPREMKFRPCIDLHDGQVKQIVGSTLKDVTTLSATSGECMDDDENDSKNSITVRTEPGATNFSTTRPASEYAQQYRHDGLVGGHVIMLGPGNVDAAKEALAVYPRGLQIGGGISDMNCVGWLESGASHVIVTSYVFDHGQIMYDRLEKLVQLVGKDHLVLDLSCRKKPDNVGTFEEHTYFVVTNKWQTFSDFAINSSNLQCLSQYCDEFLVHAVDVEGKRCGVLEDLIELLGHHSPIPVTYAGGARSIEDLEIVKRVGQGKVDCTIGSALDIFGGDLSYDEVVRWHNNQVK